MSLAIYKVKRYYKDFSAPERTSFKDQTLYEGPRHMLQRFDGPYYSKEVFVAQPFINNNDGVEMRWVLLTSAEIEQIRQEYKNSLKKQ